LITPAMTSIASAARWTDLIRAVAVIASDIAISSL
jgi:hypothetical protein